MSEFSREQIDQAKQRIRRQQRWTEFREGLERLGQLDDVARAELEAEERQATGSGTSDDVTRQDVLRATLVRGMPSAA